MEVQGTTLGPIPRTNHGRVSERFAVPTAVLPTDLKMFQEWEISSEPKQAPLPGEHDSYMDVQGTMFGPILRTNDEPASGKDPVPVGLFPDYTQICRESDTSSEPNEGSLHDEDRLHMPSIRKHSSSGDIPGKLSSPLF